MQNGSDTHRNITFDCAKCNKFTVFQNTWKHIVQFWRDWRVLL